MIVVRLSQRNILALLHKLVMPGSAREIIKWSEDQSGVGLPSEQVAIRVATDDEVYGARRPGEMHPDTERFVSAMEEQVARIIAEMYPSDQVATAMSWDQWFNLGFSVFLIGIFLVGDYLQRRHYRRNP